MNLPRNTSCVHSARLQKDAEKISLLNYKSSRLPENITQMSLTSPIKKFLDSIPGLALKQQQLSQSSDFAAARKSIRDTIHPVVKSRLARQESGDEDSWISELIGFNEAGDDVEFVTNFLADYVTEEPWIISEALFRCGASLAGAHDKNIKLQRGSFCGSPDHSGCENLSQLLTCHDDQNASPETTRIQSFMLPCIWPERNELGNSTDGLSGNLPFQIDSLLGLAGFIPLPGLNSADQRWTETSVPKFNENYQLQEFRTHVSIKNNPASMLHYAKVSLLGYKEPDFTTSGSEQWLDWNISVTSNLIVRITSMIKRLKVALQICQEKGRFPFGIPFLKREKHISRSHVISTEIITILMLEKFFSAFEEIKNSYFSLLRTKQRTQALEMLAWDTGPPSTPDVRGVLPPATGLLDPVIRFGWFALFGPAVFAIGAIDRALTRNREPLNSNLSNLMKCLLHILEKFGTDLRVARPGPTAALHLSVLAIQALCLAVQSGVRGSCSPLGSSFLAHDLDQIFLDGANKNGGSRITASTCSLTCFGDMLGQNVLVFGEPSPRPETPTRFDLVCSIQEVLSIWGPGKLLVTERLLANGGKEFTVSGVEIGGGILHPVRSKSEPAVPKWHWSMHGTAAVDADDDLFRAIIKLNTKIQIGVPPASTGSTALEPQIKSQANDQYSAVHFLETTSPKQFKPVGPCNQNHRCAHTNTDADIARRQEMAPFLKDIGSHESYTVFAGYEVGGQVGYSFTSQVMTTWERRPATSVKQVQITERQSPQEVLANMGKIHGLFISNCTEVMARARVCDVVALIGPILHRDKFPTLKGYSTSEESIPVILQALQGSENFSKWASTMLDSDNRPLDQSLKLKDLTLAVLRTLEGTGVRPNDFFEAAWVSLHQEKAGVRALCRTNPWLYCLSDSEHISTFACITHFCLEAPGHQCVNSPQPKCSLMRGLGRFALSSRVLAFEVLPQSESRQTMEQEYSLRLNGTYLINSRALNTVATVKAEHTTSAFGHYYELEVTKSKVGPLLVKRLILREKVRLLRESNELLAKSCIIRGPTSSRVSLD
ncbi:hypothetical protein EDB80DRAFT_320486 [Ilyonectria destructans]|nr:hypothetical protein EDB80DRAFT_320486 [Ilyonectria destructans]